MGQLRRVLTVLTLTLLATTTLDAQREPRRPRLPSGDDPADPRAYLEAGHRLIDRDPSGAAEAYYWARRLDPESAEALYGHWASNLIRQPSFFLGYWEGRRTTLFHPRMVQNDSLYLRALQLNPFLHPRHRRIMELAYWRRVVGDGVNQGMLDFYINDAMDRAGTWPRARIAVADGNFPLAITLYNQAIAASREPLTLHLERGAVFAMQGMDPAAIEDYNTGLAELRKRDLSRDRVVVYYASKALHEHAVGLLYGRQGKTDEAQAAFGRAMTEDLSFFPSHVALAQAALAAGDSATALSEMALAAEVAPNEAPVLFRYGELLERLGRYDEAIAPLTSVVTGEPYWAAPRFLLGEAQERTGATAEAAASYQKFLELAPQRDARRAEATRRRTALGQGTP